MSNSAFRPGSDEEWEELMHQFRQHPKPLPQPFFYARVHTRLTASQPVGRTLLPSWLRRPAYAFLLVALVLAVSSDGATLHPLATSNQYHGYRLGQPAPLPAR